MSISAANLVHGWDQLAYVMTESTFGALEDVTGGGAFEFISVELGENESPDNRPRKDKRNARGHKARVQGKIDPTPFTVRSTFAPSGDAGDVEADIAPFLKAAFGTETQNAGTSYVYTFADRPDAGISMVVGDAALNYCEYLYGGLVQQVRLVSGGEEPEFEFSGMALGKSTAAEVTTNVGALLDAIVTTIQLVAGEQYKLVGVGQLLQDPAELGEQMKVTAVDYTTGIITVIREHIGTATTHADGFTLQPYLPVQSLAATVAVIGEHEGAYILGGLSVFPTELEIEINTGLEHRQFEKGSQHRRAAVVTKGVTATGSVTLYGDLDNMIFLARAQQAAVTALDFTIGDTTAFQLQIEADTVELGKFPVDVPEIEEALVTIPFTCYGWDNGTSPIQFTLK